MNYLKKYLNESMTQVVMRNQTNQHRRQRNKKKYGKKKKKVLLAQVFHMKRLLSGTSSFEICHLSGA